MTDAEFEELFAYLSHDVHRYVSCRIDPDDVEDVIVDTFTVVWQKGRVLPAEEGERGAFRVWVLGIARRLLANRRRARQCRQPARQCRQRHEHEAVLRTVRAGEALAPDPAWRVVARRDAAAAFSRLEPADQTILMLVAWDGLAGGDLRAALGCSRKAASVRLVRARRRLNGLLDGQDRS